MEECKRLDCTKASFVVTASNLQIEWPAVYIADQIPLEKAKSAENVHGHRNRWLTKIKEYGARYVRENQTITEKFEDEDVAEYVEFELIKILIKI